MSISKGDTFRRRPVTMRVAGDTGPQTEPMTGRVVYVNSNHNYALLDFGRFRECFSFYGPAGLLTARGGGDYDTV